MVDIRQRRLAKGWSQEHLAEVAGLSVRTIQRIEGGQKPGLESLKCLAAVFETEISDLTQEPKMTEATETQTSLQEERKEYVDAFWMNFIALLVITPAYYWLNFTLTPGFLWANIVAVLWATASAVLGVIIVVMFGWPSSWRKD